MAFHGFSPKKSLAHKGGHGGGNLAGTVWLGIYVYGLDSARSWEGVDEKISGPYELKVIGPVLENVKRPLRSLLADLDSQGEFITYL